MDYIYCDVIYAIRTHDSILKVSGGLYGLIDQGRLESILAHIQNNDYTQALKRN